MFDRNARLASPVVATPGSLLLSRSILSAVAHLCCSMKDRAPLRNFSWSRVPQQQQSWPWTDGLDRDDHERPTGPVLHRRRCAEATIPPKRITWAYAPMRGVSACRAGLSTPTCDPWSQSLASFTPTRNSQAQSHASFVDIQINEVDPRIAKQPIHHASQYEDLLALSTPVQESSSAVELLRHVLSFAIAAATSDDSVIGSGGHKSWTSNGAERPREVRRIQVLVQLNLEACSADTFMSVNSMSRHNCLQDNLGRMWKTRTTVDSAKTLQPQQLTKQLNCLRSFRIGTRTSLDIEQSSV